MKGRGKALVIEDNKMWAAQLKEALEENNFVVTVAQSRDEGLAILENELFHFATIDLQLNEATSIGDEYEGWHILKKILDKGLERLMPIMIITGFPKTDETDNKIKAIKKYKTTFFIEKSKWNKKDFVKTVIESVENWDTRFINDKRV